MEMQRIKRTYMRSDQIVKRKRPTKTKLVPKAQIIDDTLDESYWKDSFDRLLDEQRALRDAKVLKTKNEINAEMNRDSSLDESKVKQKTNAKKRKQAKDPYDKFVDKVLRNMDENYKQEKVAKKARLEELKKVQISTPAKRRRNNKALEFSLSPITQKDKEKSWFSDGDNSVLGKLPGSKKNQSLNGQDAAEKPENSQGAKKRKTNPVISTIASSVSENSTKSPEPGKSGFQPVKKGLKTYSRRSKPKTSLEISNSFSLLEVPDDPGNSGTEETKKPTTKRKSSRVSLRKTVPSQKAKETRKSARRTRNSVKILENQADVGSRAGVSSQIPAENENQEVPANVSPEVPENPTISTEKPQDPFDLLKSPGTVAISKPNTKDLQKKSGNFSADSTNFNYSIPDDSVVSFIYDRKSRTKIWLKRKTDYLEASKENEEASKENQEVAQEEKEIEEIPASPKVTKRKSKRKTNGKVRVMDEIVEEPVPGTAPIVQEKSLRSEILNDFTEFESPAQPVGLFVATRKPKKSVAIRMDPEIREFSSLVPETIPSRQSRKSSLIGPTSRTEIKLQPGKWRKSLAAFKKSLVCDNNDNDKARISNRRVSIYVPQKSNDCDIRRATERLNETLSNSIVFEQSDEENLSAFSVIDESISIHKATTKLHDLQKTKRVPQRQTSCFERSSLFYGLSSGPANVVDILPKLSSKQIVLRRCGQTEPLLFDDIYSEVQLPNCRKIGEGVYGEVYMYKEPTGEPIVLKIIPIEGDLLVNGEPQKKFEAILSEVVITMELSQLRHGKEFKTSGFVELRKINCVQGVYPTHLIDLWELFRDNQGTENEHPEIFPEDQLYIVLELGNAGQDLEAFRFDNAEQSYSAFLQTALTLAVAEQKLEFEHRDLHWGNILVKRTDEKYSEFCIDGKLIKIPTHGIKTTIIDFTLSRMVYDGCCFFDDLANDPDLFVATGDYQFDIYRFMRDKVENQFERFEPYTNILWLHYVIDKMIDGVRYINTKTKKHRAAINDLMQLRDELLDYKSASDYIKCLSN